MGTARYGWNSPGSFTCRSTALETTRTTSTDGCAGAGAGACAAAVAAIGTRLETMESLCLTALVIVCARRVVGIQGWRKRADSRLHEGVHRRKDDQRRHRRQQQTADDGTAERRGLGSLSGAQRK